MTRDVWYVRDPTIVAVSTAGQVVFIPANAEPIAIEQVDADALGALLSRTAVPASGSALAAICAPESLDLLVEHGVLWRGDEHELMARLPGPRNASGSRRCRRAVVGVCGAVSATGILFDVLEIAEAFAEEVDVILTDAATRFVDPRVFEYWGLRTWVDPFEPRHQATVPHIHLATHAEMVLVAPATASTLHRLASGASSDLLSLVVVATTAPVVVVPAMNGNMWRNPAVARNVAQLRADGIWVIEPGIGFEVSERGASGDVGGGGYGRSPGGLVRTLNAILEQGASTKSRS